MKGKSREIEKWNEVWSYIGRTSKMTKFFWKARRSKENSLDTTKISLERTQEYSGQNSFASSLKNSKSI
jgi:hypothetical protein